MDTILLTHISFNQLKIIHFIAIFTTRNNITVSLLSKEITP